MPLCYLHWRLESLLFDDLIQEMMRADNVDPDEIRTLFSKLATVKHSGVAARRLLPVRYVDENEARHCRWISGWARLMYECKPTLVETSDFVNMPPGITHYLYDYSTDMCFLEIAMAGAPDGMIPEEAVEPFCKTPTPTPWANG